VADVRTHVAARQRRGARGHGARVRARAIVAAVLAFFPMAARGPHATELTARRGSGVAVSSAGELGAGGTAGTRHHHGTWAGQTRPVVARRRALVRAAHELTIAHLRWGWSSLGSMKDHI
jgi:hypothetical protein